MENVGQTIISQYANSATLVQLINNLNAYLDPGPLFDEFYAKVWDIDTAEGHGLDIWGRIVGVSRELNVVQTVEHFGFNGGVGSPFNQAPFWTGTPATSAYTLADDAYRTLIMVKAFANIAATVPPVLNALLQQLFSGRGRCYVSSTGNMAMRYTFEFYLLPFEIALLTQSGALPQPTGVAVTLLQAPQGGTFGFQEAGDAEPFGYGTFLSREAIINVG